jgi:alkanesulfonate monooxygenase SsuD/methylene tetrahydromethanopterin reductase-like flavin-dependent oxidoreductase (luciferase family)
VTEPDQLREDVGLYYDSVEEAGKDPDDAEVTIMVDGYVAETTDDAYDALEPYMLDLHEKYIKWGNPEFDRRPTWEDVEDQVMIGTPAEVAEKVEMYRDIGVDSLIFRTQFPGMDQQTALESVRRFGDEVVPEFE